MSGRKVRTVTLGVVPGPETEPEPLLSRPQRVAAVVLIAGLAVIAFALVLAVVVGVVVGVIAFARWAL